MEDDNNQDAGKKVSYKEKARLHRKAAYQRAKAAVKANPQIQARKEEAKVRRRAMYDKIKASQKEKVLEARAEEKNQLRLNKLAAPDATDQALSVENLKNLGKIVAASDLEQQKAPQTSQPVPERRKGSHLRLVRAPDPS